MTNVVFPPDTTLLLEALLIDGGSGPPTSQADGELYIDEAARILYVPTDAGRIAMPLDVQGMPPTRSVPTSNVLVKTAAGAEWQALTGGGGAASWDAEPWRIPGLAPLAIGSLVFPAASGGQSVFHLGQPETLMTVRVRALAGNGNLTIALHKFDGTLGAQVFTRTFAISAAGVYTYPLNLPMALGDYAMVYTSTSGLTMETIEGYMPWTAARQTFPAILEF